jgi:hypothetical protein
MTGQQWRTYALLLHLIATYKVVDWLLDNFDEPWGFITSMFVAASCLVGLIVPVSRDRAAKHRREEATA